MALINPQKLIYHKIKLNQTKLEQTFISVS